jgi:hypothetical protein
MAGDRGHRSAALPKPVMPLTLGQALAAGVRLIV